MTLANCSGSATTLQQSYDADTNGSDTLITLSSNDDSLIFRNPSSGGTDSSFAVKIDQLDTGAKDGLVIIQSGTGDAFRVNDDGTDTDSTPFVINSGGSVGIGVSNPSTFKVQVAGSIGPNADDTYDLGSSSYRWRDLYLGPSSLHIGTNGNEGTISYNTTSNYLQLDASEVRFTGGIVKGSTVNVTSGRVANDYESGYSDSTDKDGTIRIGSDGFARMSSYKGSISGLSFTRCLNNDCTSKNTTTIASGTSTGYHQDMVLGQDGYPRFAFYDNPNQVLKHARCTDADCTSPVITSLASTNSMGYEPSITIGSDGFSRISHYNSGTQGLMFTQCLNADCTSKLTTSVETGTDNGHYSAVAMGNDGFPRIVYGNSSGSGSLNLHNAQMRIALSKNITTIDSNTGGINGPSSIAIGIGFAGLPIQMLSLQHLCSVPKRSAVHQTLQLLVLLLHTQHHWC